jgi:hypothetical protein
MQTSALAEQPRVIEPLVKNWFHVPGGGNSPTFTAACFRGANWSLKPLQRPADARAPANADLVSRLNDALLGLGAEIALAPYPGEKFTGRVVSHHYLEYHLKLGGVYLWRNRDIWADSVALFRPKISGIFSAGGCGIVVMAYKDQLLFGHAGRESLLDRMEVLTNGRKKMRPKSLIGNMFEALKVPAGKEDQVYAWPLYFIKPEEFRHNLFEPKLRHRIYNKAAASFLPKRYGEDFGWIEHDIVYIDLPKIAKFDLMECGVPERNIMMEHCYLPDELPTTRKGNGTDRYLVVVVRHT